MISSPKSTSCNGLEVEEHFNLLEFGYFSSSVDSGNSWAYNKRNPHFFHIVAFHSFTTLKDVGKGLIYVSHIYRNHRNPHFRINSAPVERDLTQHNQFPQKIDNNILIWLYAKTKNKKRNLQMLTIAQKAKPTNLLILKQPWWQQLEGS